MRVTQAGATAALVGGIPLLTVTVNFPGDGQLGCLQGLALLNVLPTSSELSPKIHAPGFLQGDAQRACGVWTPAFPVLIAVSASLPCVSGGDMDPVLNVLKQRP